LTCMIRIPIEVTCFVTFVLFVVSRIQSVRRGPWIWGVAVGLSVGYHGPGLRMER